MGKILPVLLVFSLLYHSSMAQNEVRQFTNKNGQQIKAALLDVSSDMKNMKIRREDGVEFETEIVALSLDDQQYIKDWLKNRPSKTDFRLDVAISKKVVESETRPYNSSYYKLHQDQVGYEIVIRNLSRESLPNPIVSYQVVRLEGASIYQASDGDWTYTGDSDDRVQVVLADTVNLTETLAFNREVIVTTEPALIERVMYDTTVQYSDELIGVIVQVKNDKGDLVGEFRSTGKEIQNLSWEDAAGLRPDRSGRGPGRIRPSADDDEMGDGPRSYTMQKGDREEGPIRLNGMPISISATVDPGSSDEGVIVSIGGDAKGLAVFLRDKEVVAVQNVDGNLRTVSFRQPLGDFKVGVNLTAASLELLIDDQVVNKSASGGLFSGSSQNGIEIGQDSDRPVGDYKAPFPFPGSISDVTILIGI